MPRMNGTERNIEIFKPFGDAFELMKRILFQPFDFAKWLVIGFAAFLANLSGNAGFHYSRNSYCRIDFGNLSCYLSVFLSAGKSTKGFRQHRK